VLSILLVADPHFGPKHLPEASAAVLTLARRAQPAALVVAGDLTQRAKPHQFRAAADWLRDAPCPVAYVPGNHDVPLYRVWERLFAPFDVWRRWLDPQLVREVRTPELALHGLNTAFPWTTKHGRVDRVELAAVGARLDVAPPGALRVLVAHHPLAYAPDVGGEPVARRGEEAIDLCRREGVELVLAGHLHRSFWFFAAAGEPVPGPLVVHCGTTTSSRGRGAEKGRSSLVWIEVDADAIRLEQRFWNATAGEFATGAAASFPRRAPEAAASRVS
jgi:3',5'-cyclic AMP phosphodiesterase CpdA